MHICRAGNGKHQGKQKKKVNVRKNQLFSRFLKGVPLLRCNSSKQILLIFLQNPLLPGRTKPITMGKSCPNTWLHKVQGLGQTWGRIIPDPIHYSSQTWFPRRCDYTAQKYGIFRPSPPIREKEKKIVKLKIEIPWNSRNWNSRNFIPGKSIKTCVGHWRVYNETTMGNTMGITKIFVN